jgi:hypothetical protein
VSSGHATEESDNHTRDFQLHQAFIRSQVLSFSGCVGGANPYLLIGADGKVTTRPPQSFQICAASQQGKDKYGSSPFPHDLGHDSYEIAKTAYLEAEMTR